MSPATSTATEAIRRCASDAALPASAVTGSTPDDWRTKRGTVRTSRMFALQLVSPTVSVLTKLIATDSVQPTKSLSVTTWVRFGNTTCTAFGNCAVVSAASSGEVTESRSPDITSVGTVGNMNAGGSGTPGTCEGGGAGHGRQVSSGVM